MSNNLKSCIQTLLLLEDKEDDDLLTLMALLLRKRRKQRTSQDFSGANEIKVFCPKCNTEVSHTAEGIQQDQTKILIAKVYHYFEQEYEDLKKMYGHLDLTPLSDFRQRTALATGVSETTLLEILKEEEGRNADKRRKPSQKRRAARKRRRPTDSSSEEDTSADNDDDVEQPRHTNESLLVKVKPCKYSEELENCEIMLPVDVKLEPSDGEIDIEEPEIFLPPVKVEPSDSDTDKIPKNRREERLLKKRMAERRRKARIKSNPEQAEALRKRERERYHQKKREGKLVSQQQKERLLKKRKAERRKARIKSNPEQAEALRKRERYHQKKKEGKLVSKQQKERLLKKKMAERRRKARIKSNPEQAEALRKRDRERYHQKKERRQHTPGGVSSAPVASGSAPLTETLNKSCLPGEREIKKEIEIHEEGFS